MSQKQSKNPKDQHPSSKLLNPAEAALYLGVTPELVFAYALYPPKKAAGDKFTLAYTSEGGHSGFLRADLESFDSYLKQPWSEPGASRPKIPRYVEDYLKVECGGQCARCGRGYKLENAHIVPFAESRSHHHHNLIRLCVECHEEFETKLLITYSEIYELKQILIAKVRERLVACMNPTRSGFGRIPNPALQFVGREHDLGVLVEVLNQHRCISIEGLGGIGKTQLLINALQLTSNPRPILWMNLEAYKNVYDLKIALASNLSELGSPVSINSIADTLAKADVRLVFDGVEQLSPADMDEVEDFFGNLLTMTSDTQLIFTSQVELINLDLEKRLQLGPLSNEASLFVLQSALPPELRRTTNEAEGLHSLVKFCQGHPLSLQIVTGLLLYFRSASVVMERIRRSGGAAIQNPTRNRQNTHTSLRTCLLLSYQTLSANQRKLLWLTSQCPAGFNADNLEVAELGIEDSVADIASLRRWHLIDVEENGPFGTRLQILSPIRAFVNSEFQAERAHEIEELEYLLVNDLNIQADILDIKFMQNGDVMLGRLLFSIELPNFMHALRISVERASDRSLSQAALMASSLMVYCFVSGFVKRGVEIMQIGADAASRIGKKNTASEILTRLLFLAARSSNVELIQASTEELARLADGSSDPYLIANAHFGRGMIALMKEEFSDAGESFAAAAIEYEQIVQSKATRLAQMEKNEDESLSVSCDGAKHMLAMALKQQGEVHEKTKHSAEALPYYERALTLVNKGNDQINIGSILHHIGNCYADSKQVEKALDSYLAAAKQFQSIQFEEYLSNSLAELGYLLLGWDPPSSFYDFISEELIADGLNDVARQVERMFMPLFSVVPSDNHVQTIRKVFGVTALASFSSNNHLLADWAFYLREEVLSPLIHEGELSGLDITKKLLLMHLDLTLAIAGSLSEVEQTETIGPYPTIEEIEHLARLCYNYLEPGWAKFHPFEWLATYLRRHRGTSAIQPDVLRSAAEEAVTLGHEFSVVL